jgi:two-component system, chemotaxis family, response regulator Rcp1
MPIEILLVEDNDGDARLLREVFREANKDVRLSVVPDGVEAMAFLTYQGKYLDAPRPDLILLDLNMPKMDGREVLVRVKANPQLKTIPVIVLTTSEAESDIVSSYGLMASCYLTKPGELADFEKLVKSLNDFWLTSASVKLPKQQRRVVTNSNQRSLADPKAYLNFARQYFLAADELAGNKSRVEYARYYLYFHATELLLKAYLRLKGKDPSGYELSKLLKECNDQGLLIDSEDKYGLRNLASLLESGNEEMGFRYFTLKSGSLPEMGWTHEVVRRLEKAVTAVVDPDGDSTKPGLDVKAVFVIGKPAPQDKPHAG